RVGLFHLGRWAVQEGIADAVDGGSNHFGSLTDIRKIGHLLPFRYQQMKTFIAMHFFLDLIKVFQRLLATFQKVLYQMPPRNGVGFSLAGAPIIGESRKSAVWMKPHPGASAAEIFASIKSPRPLMQGCRRTLVKL